MLALNYKDYTGETDFDWGELCWVGHVINADIGVGFYGATVEEAERRFREAIDAYLSVRGELQQESEKAA